MDWWVVVIVVTIDFLLGMWWQRHIDRRMSKRDFPYQWRCQEAGCNFFIKGVSLEGVNEIIDAHEKYHNNV